MDKRQNIVVLGAGYAGVTAVKKLCKKLKPYKDQYRVVLVDRRPYHTLLTDLHEVAGGRIEQEAVLIDLRKLFGHMDVDVITDEIIGVDYEANKVTLESGDVIDYKYLVMGLGSQTSFFGIPGVEENSLTLWSYEDAVKIREHVMHQFDRARGIKNSEIRRQMLTFVVAGGGFTGVEMAGELGEWVKTLCEHYQIERSEVRVMLVEAMDKLCPMFQVRESLKISKRFKKLGVEVLLNSPITEAKKGEFTIKKTEAIKTNTLIWTAGVVCNEFVKDTGITTARHQRAQANEYLQSVDHDNVFLIGDNAYLEEDGKPILQVVETAVQTADVVAENIVASIKGEQLHGFKSNYHGFMVSVGGRYAVADVMGMKLSGFFAMALKHLVNVHYLFEIGGFAVVWHYLYAEFFSMTQNRSILGGHVSRTSHVFWLVPLRIYIGVMWLLEGVKKIQDGWLKPENIYIIQLDGVSAASEAWEETAATIIPIFENPPAIYQWFMDTFIAQAPFLFQASVVLMEVAIGLALIGGLFTVLASVGSVFLGFNFILSAMADWSILWYIIAPIALIGGGGRAFGLDYYVMPVLKRFYKRLGIVKKTRLYID
jgi:NADH dehydrogenase